MRSSSAIYPLCLLVVALAAAQTPPPETTAPPPVAPQGITVVLDRSSQVPIVTLAFPAIPGTSALPNTAANAARELEQTLRRDLERSGIFELLGPEQLGVLTLTGDLERDADQYRSLGAAMLLAAEVELEGDRLVLEGRLVDLASRQTIVGKRYRGTFDLARRIAHTFADEIVLFLTSKRGIAMTAIALYSDRDGHKEIYMMDYDGYDQRKVTAHQSISMSPSWSGQGNTIAYVSYFGGKGPALYLADIATGKKSPLVTEGTFNASPSFSPDGRRVAFARALGANIEIFVCDRDGSGVRRLTNSGGIDMNPAWSPSGQEIAFTSSRSGSPQLYVMDAEGSNLRRVTFEGEYNDGASWSPDGTRLAYATRVDRSRFDIAVLDLVSLAAKRLTAGSGSNEAPSFSPDGRRIAFTSSRAGGTQIFAMSVADGSDVEQLTREGSNWAPDWSAYLR
ncbi:MAG TPA: Tol-Pal system beta propeller repeat protein TolB [Thermoanaerobaculia bacterium]|nr:Tol-Pal system beta propeller repeat protein TolB [Thermoanaerobaculia bacterium]